MSTKEFGLGTGRNSYFRIFPHPEQREDDLQKIILFLLVGVAETSFLFMSGVEILVSRDVVDSLLPVLRLTKQVT